MTVIDDVVRQVSNVKREHDWYVGLCPVHEADGNGHKSSLRFRPATDVDDGALVCCMAGCTAEELRGAFGFDDVKIKVSTTDAKTFLFYRLSPNLNGGDDEWTPHGPAIATYRYRDEQSQLLFAVCRTADKSFPCWHPDPDKPHGKSWSMDGVRRVLYRLPELIAAVAAGETVYVVEGEKDVDAIVQAGGAATCNPGGAGKWCPECSSYLRGADVVIVADCDEPGRKHAQQVAGSVRAIANSVRIVEAKTGKDAADHLAAGFGLDELVAVAQPEAAASLPIHTVADLLAMQIPRPQYIVGPPFALACGTVVELDAYPKSGKTRFSLDAIWSVLHGLPFLDAPTTKVKVLYLTEEWLITWSEALAEAHLLTEQNSDLHWMSLIDLQGRDAGDWSEICEMLRRYCLANGVGVLVVDTLARWAGVSDENDAVAMAAAVLPLRLIAAESIAVLFLRHDRKGGGQVGESGRGSSATTGEADHVLHLQRKAGQGEASLRQRELEGVGRLTGMTGKLIVELNDSGHFDLVGSRSDVLLQQATEHVLNVLPMRKEEAWTVKELAERFRGSPSTLNRAISELCRSGEISGQLRAGHAAESKSKKAIGYWRLLEEQEGLEFDEC